MNAPIVEILGMKTQTKTICVYHVVGTPLVFVFNIKTKILSTLAFDKVVTSISTPFL